MVNRMQLTYDEFMGVLYIEFFRSKRTSYTTKPGKHKVSNINKTLQFLFPDIVKVNITIDDIMLKSN